MFFQNEHLMIQLLLQNSVVLEERSLLRCKNKDDKELTLNDDDAVLRGHSNESSVEKLIKKVYKKNLLLIESEHEEEQKQETIDKLRIVYKLLSSNKFSTTTGGGKIRERALACRN